jgi:hypothetical protein
MKNRRTVTREQGYPAPPHLFRWLISAFFLLSCAFAPCVRVEAAAPSEEKPGAEARPTPRKTQQVELTTNYWDLYPRREDVSLRAIERLPEGIGFLLRLQSNVEGFSHFLYAVNDAPFEKSANGTVAVRFEDKHNADIQRTTVAIKAVSTAGATSKLYAISMNFYPKELYAASGQTAPGYVIVQKTDLVFATSQVEDWILQHPSPDERNYARKKWGSLIADGRSDHENACAIARSILDDLEPHRGIPSDEMSKLTPFKQYERVMEGKDHVWCGNIAAIFAYACNALDIPCRNVGMRCQGPPNPSGVEGPRMLLAEGHSTTEIFDRQRNCWVWMDLTFNILTAYLGTEGPIHMAEFYGYLNDPVRASSLRIAIYDAKSKTEKTVSCLKSDKKDSLFNYFKQDQRFFYTRQDREKR